MQLAPPPEEPVPRQPSYWPWLVALALLFCGAAGGVGWWLKTAGTKPNPPQASTDTGAKSNIPPEFLADAQQAKTLFANGDYVGAEKIYTQILRKVPDNHYVLSNLGVVYFRRGKYKEAEEVLVKATRIAPEDGFSHSTLGITYYTEQKFDDAVKSLGRAVVLNPNDAVAHNYLGITAASKGWQESAQKELETACTIDPNYADAHFNLAIVLSTQRPPNKEKAREYYQRAVALGAEVDSALEAMLK
jgi:Flp pilus assembly protein TadD